jgi:hypothetical protein
MPLASRTAEWTRIQLPKSITADAVDERLVAIPEPLWQTRIDLDLSAATSIDVPALQYFLSFLNERARVQLETAFSTPRLRVIRDLIMAWDFPAVASLAYGSSFRSLIWQDDSAYFDERRKGASAEAQTARRSTTTYERLRGSRFFCLAAHLFHTPAQVGSIIEAESARWRSPLVLGFLDNGLKAAGSEFARVVIHELLVNAVRRPRADLVTIVPFIEPTSDQLCVSVWDNGTPMIDDACTNPDPDGPPRHQPPSYDKFYVNASGWANSASQYTSEWVPGAGTTDEELLLFKFFASASTCLPERGMNALSRCVIDLFGGSLQVRTGNQHVDLRSRSRRRRDRAYQVDLVRHAGRPFHGNLITVRIPMTHAT